MKRYYWPLIAVIMLVTFERATADGIFAAKVPLLSACTGNICSNINQPQLSLLVMEKITKKLEFKSWTGLVPNFWFSSEAGLLYKINPRVKLGGDITFSHSYLPGITSDYMGIRGVIEFKAW